MRNSSILRKKGYAKKIPRRLSCPDKPWDATARRPSRKISPRREFELGFVFFGGENEVGGKFIAAFGDEILDQRRAALSKQFFDFVGRDFVFAEFLGELEHLAVVL